MSAGTGELSSILMSSIDSSYFMNDLYPSENITASFHPHPLRLKDAHETPYYCVGCKEKGLGKYYQCEDPENCDYHLHRQCCDLSTLCESGNSSSIKFSFLESKKCDFVFQKEAPGANQRGCDACGRDVKGWSYQCKMCKIPHYLHPCCAKLPINLKGEKGIVLDLKAKTSSKCLECGSKNISQGLRGWFYASNCGEHCYHVGCVMDMVLKNLEKGGHGCDDGRYLIKETSDERKSCSCESTSAQSGAITKRSRKLGTKKLITKATITVLNLIISAILGIPITSACVAFYNLF